MVAGCVSGGLRGASPARQLNLARYDSLSASRRGGGCMALGAVPVAGVELEVIAI